MIHKVKRKTINSNDNKESHELQAFALEELFSCHFRQVLSFN